MRFRSCMVVALALTATLGAPSTATPCLAQATQPDEMHPLDGEWIYVEDLTEGRALEQLGPPMSSTFALRMEEGAVVLVRGHGSGHRDVRIALDGSITEIVEPTRTTRYRAEWEDGALVYEVEFVREPGTAPTGLFRRAFRVTADGLEVRFAVGSPAASESVGLYRHAEDIAMPEPAMAAIGDMAWLAGAWVGTRGQGGATSIEERWSPPLGGAMLGVSRTVRGGSMRAFEFLRIVERDGGLVYIAQPGGTPPTEFVLTELSAEAGLTRAVFDNPRHDYPKRIVYELSAEGVLRATVGFTKGGTPGRFEFRAEGR